MTVPYLAHGLERKERCVYVGDPDSVDAMREGLRSAGIDPDREIQKGRIILSSDREYLENGRFNTNKMLGFLQQSYDAALADGCSALRATGDVSWEVGPDQDYRDVVYYETLLDLFFQGKQMVGMCQYPMDLCPDKVLLGILNTHKIAAIGEELCDNFHYTPPELLLEKDPSVRDEKQVGWMISQLRRARR